MEPFPLDLDDETACRQTYEAGVASICFERPWAEPDDFDRWWTRIRQVDPGERDEHWAIRATADGPIVGDAMVSYPLDDNTDKAWLAVQVHPSHRRQGLGGALITTLLERIDREGRTPIAEFHTPEVSPEQPYCRFVLRHGFVHSNTEIVRHLSLPVPEARLEDLWSAALPKWEGRYRLETYVGEIPAERLPSMVAVANTLAADAPTGDIAYEEERVTPERFALLLEQEREVGRQRITTAALDNETDLVVAHTDLIVPPAPREYVDQWGTTVHRDHRGRRLGMAIKIENLRHAQAAHPDRLRVVTQNDDTNDHMVGINLDLGFEVVEYTPAYWRPR